MKQVILRIESAFDIEEAGAEFEKELTDFGLSFNNQLVGSQEINGEILILTISKYESQVLDDMFSMFDVTWETVAEEGVEIDQSLILPFMVDKPIFNEEGEQVGSEPVTNITDKLQTFSGRNWKY